MYLPRFYNCATIARQSEKKKKPIEIFENPQTSQMLDQVVAKTIEKQILLTYFDSILS